MLGTGLGRTAALHTTKHLHQVRAGLILVPALILPILQMQDRTTRRKYGVPEGKEEGKRNVSQSGWEKEKAERNRRAGTSKHNS